MGINTLGLSKLVGKFRGLSARGTVSKPREAPNKLMT